MRIRQTSTERNLGITDFEKKTLVILAQLPVFSKEVEQAVERACTDEILQSFLIQSLEGGVSYDRLQAQGVLGRGGGVVPININDFYVYRRIALAELRAILSTRPNIGAAPIYRLLN